MVSKEETLRRKIKSGQAMYDLSNSDMAAKMHMSLPSWERRLMNPGKISFLELCRLDQILHMNLMNMNG